ncbi:C1 family peptidase [Bacillus paralicheniformis]|uniref:C1 family peptidase n=1 Tax=Bacillus paralicheniformis TaxID=1648923 RepID=UPI0039829FFA
MEELKGLGFVPSPDDKRDLLMTAFLPMVPIPSKFTYEERDLTPVRDQGAEGTCVGFATAVGVKEFQEKKEHGKEVYLSPRFIYQKCKERDGIPDQEGTYIRIALEVVKEFGVCEEVYWPYEAHRTGSPKPNAEENAKNHKIKAYARLFSQNDPLDTRLDAIKRSIIVNGPLVAGVPVYRNWMTQEVYTTGKVPNIDNSSLVGGHAICIVGYDDETELFKFKNSWNTGWGDNGYGYLPYEYMSHSYTEAWSSTDLIEDPDQLIRSKEKVLEDFGVDYKDKPKEFKEFKTKIDYH